jgi:hypothetical protein
VKIKFKSSPTESFKSNLEEMNSEDHPDLITLQSQLALLQAENLKLKSQQMQVIVPSQWLPKPNKYDRARAVAKVREYVYRIDRFLKSNGSIPPEHYITVAAEYLTGQAYSWFNRWILSHPNASYDSFIIALKDHFEPHGQNSETRYKLGRLTQITSVQIYITKFRELLEEIDDISEKEAKTYFLNGLKAQTRKEVKLKDLDDTATLDAIEELAFQIDHILFTSAKEGSRFVKKPFSKPAGGPVPMEGVVYNALSPEEKNHLSRERRCFRCKQKELI